MDNLSPEHRSWNMSRIRNKNTGPEMRVRSQLHRMGYRFRLHRRDLPGKPDIILPKFHCVIFVHGCFWHRHRECRLAYTPKSRLDFWLPKFERTVQRDAEKKQQLESSGWKVHTIWECQTLDVSTLESYLRILLQ